MVGTLGRRTSMPGSFFRPSLLLSVAILLSMVFAQDTGDSESYYLYTGEYPSRTTPSWGDNDFLANGIAHDDDNWYICSLETDVIGKPGGDWVIWRIPVSCDVDQDFDDGLCNEPDHRPVLTFRKSNEPALADYGHAGDLDRVRHDGTDYLVVPLTGGPHPAIAFFRAATLSYINYAYLSEQDNVGWCAVDSTGDLFTSKDDADAILRYSIDWARLPDTTHHNALTYAPPSYPLKDAGGTFMTLRNMQGGEFSPSDVLLYVNCGVIDCLGRGGQFPEDGLHVIDTSTWREVQRSTNQSAGGGRPSETGCFDYTFDNDGCGSDEPEGLTIWDLNNGRAPNIRGQLHVLIDDHNLLSTNTVSLKHYTSFVCPANITVECTTVGGTPATNPDIVGFLNGVTTPLQCATVSNNAPGFFAFGSRTVTFSATDGGHVHLQCGANVTVVETTPPTITCPSDTTVECSALGGTPRNDPQLTEFFGGVSATDVCDPSPSITDDAPAAFPWGVTPVLFTATNVSGVPASCPASVRVVDKIWFATASTQFLAGVTARPGDIFKSSLKCDLERSRVVPAFVPSTVGIDGLDVQANGNELFSVRNSVGIHHAGGFLHAKEENVYLFDIATGEIRTVVDWHALGINMPNVDALDQLGDGSIAFSTSTLRGVTQASGYIVLRPQNVYRFDPATGTISVVLDGISLGLSDLDGVDVYPDGRIAFSTKTNVFVRGVYLKQQNAYTLEKDGSLTLKFDGESVGLQSLADFTLEVGME